MQATTLSDLKVPGPIPTRVSRPFWDAAREGRLCLQKCEACARWVFYPRSHCPHCWSPRIAWHEASGKGVLQSYTVIHRPGHPAWNAVAPFTVAIVALQEGPTMLSLLVDIKQDEIPAGLPLAVQFVRVGDFTLPVFGRDKPLENLK